MALINTSSNSCGTNCCDPCGTVELSGCAAGVPYLQLVSISTGDATTRWLNLETGDVVTVKPTGFATGTCAEVSDNQQTCYEFSNGDTYSLYKVNGTTTVVKNGTVLTAAADITAALAVIAGATYENIADCNPAVAPDNAVCYAKEVVVPGTPAVPGSDVFTAQSSFPAKAAVNGSGALLETVFTQTYVSGAEADGQYSLRNGANDKGGSSSSYAMAFNFGIGSPAVPYKFYSQKLVGTPGQTYSAGYWAKDRAGPSASFRMDVKDGATTLATGTSGTMTTTYTNYRTSTFVMPAAGFVMVEIYNLVNGNASSNDPLLDDIGLWVTTAGTPATPDTTTLVTYRKSTLNGVDTYYDEAGVAVTGAALTTLLADIAAGVYDVVSCATCGCDPADFISTDPNQALVIGTDGKIYYKAQDAATCYSKTVTTPPTQGTAQSPATNTVLVPSNTQVTTIWDCTTDQMGTAGGTGGFNAPYSAYNGTTPMVVNDDNGMTCSTNARLDQGDILAATFQGYNGVVYGVAAGMRKLSADGLGAASVRIDIRKPDGSIVTGVASRSSTKQGGGAGWDNFGYYVSGQGSFTADQTGTYTMLITGTSAAPARLNFPEAKVVSASGEVLSVTPGTEVTTTYRKVTLNGVTTYYDEAGAAVTGAALTTLLAGIAAGEYAVVVCASCGCTAEDLLPTGGTDGQVLTVQPDGSFGWETPKAETITTFTPIVTSGTKIGTYTNEAGTVVDVYAPAPTAAINDDQVLTGDTTTNTTVTLTPTTVTDPLNPAVSQVNYTIKAEVKIDGTTITQDPTTKVLSAANQKPDVLTTVQPTPTATGNTTNLNSVFVDAAGVTWFVDSNGDAIKMSAAVFKEQNRFYADPNGSDANNGANEAPYLTAQAAVTALAAGDVAVLNEGTYAAVTMSVANTGLVGASGAYGSLSQIAAVTVSTASGTSNKISDLTITGDLARTGNAPLYVNNTTVSGNVTLDGTAYVEIRDSSIQDGSITQSGQSILFIEDSKIGTSTFATAGAVVSMRNVTIDAGDKVTIGAGVIYSLQDVVGEVVIDPAAVSVEQAALAQGATAAQAEGAVTSHFMQIRMHTPDTEASPTKVVTWDEATGELEISPLSAIASAAPLHHFETGTATAGMTTITLAKTPVLGATGKVRVSRNGVDVTRSFDWVGAVGTYNNANNYSCVWDAGDIWQVEYEAV
jgi:predicted nucleic-acid-binding Zn-ribbon protein